MTYVKTMQDLIEKGMNVFTHQDIIRLTNTNCPHAVLKQLRNLYEIDYIVERNNNKRYRKYTILKRKEKDVKKPSIWGKS